MILLIHLLFGAAAGHIIKDPFLAALLAFLSHYFLDFFPHIEYPISNIRKKQWKKAAPEAFSIVLDFSFGIAAIWLLSDGGYIIYACALVSILPDCLSFLEPVFKNCLLKGHRIFHEKKVHFFKDKKISVFWRIATQATAGAVALILLLA